MGKFKDLTGRQFGRLTAIEPLPPHGKNTALMWAGKCECGGTAIVRGTDLVNGHTMSCGCYRKMQKAIPNGFFHPESLFCAFNRFSHQTVHPCLPSWVGFHLRTDRAVSGD